MGGKSLVIPAAVVGVVDDAGAGDGMQCSDHPQYNRANPGGICALSLQDKLGRLILPSSSSNTKPSFLADGCPSSSYHSIAAVTTSLCSSDSPSSPPSYSDCIRPTVVEAVSSGYDSRVSTADNCSSLSSSHRPGRGRRTRMIPFLYQKKKRAATASAGCSNGSSAESRRLMSTATSSLITATTSSSSGGSCGNRPVFKRSKSVAPRPMGGFPEETEMLDSPRKKKGFWSFLYLSSHHHRDRNSSNAGSTTTAPASKRREGGHGNRTSATSTQAATTYIDIKLLLHPLQPPATSTTTTKSKEDAKTPRRERPPCATTEAVSFTTAAAGGAEEVDSSPVSQTSATFGRKVARSRSVGCGSRRFSGDFLERMSTGFGDRTLRRVESQREGKPASDKIAIHQSGVSGDDQELPPRRVRCGGILGGFSSSSSSYWLSDDVTSGRVPSVSAGSGGTENVTPRTRRSWAWALSSPMRALRPSSKHAPIASISSTTDAGGPSHITSSSAVGG